MKTLILLLLPFTLFSQTHTLSDGSKLVVADDLLKGAIIVNTENPIEVQFAPGVHYKVVIIERKDASTTELIRIGKTGTTPVVEKVDAEKATFTGAWIRGATPAPGWYEGTIAFSNQTGATASYTFTGRGIEIYSEHKRTHGSGVVTLSQGTNVIETKTVTFTGSDALPVKVYERHTLPLGTYTVKLTVGNGYNLIDYFSVTK